MSNDAPRRTHSTDPDHEQYLDRSIDLVARVRAAKEAAQREMESFGDVSEYEIRKIYGQKTELPYDEADTTDSDSPEKSRANAHQESHDSQVPVASPRGRREPADESTLSESAPRTPDTEEE